MKKSYFLFFVCSFLFFKQANGQCPNRDTLWNRLLYLSQVSAELTKPDQYKEQLTELLKFESLIKNCAYRNDSTHALLLQRIGVMYARLNDYVKAISYTWQAATLIRLNIHRYPSTARYLVKNFYNLSSYYGALNKLSERMAAIDSCISTASYYSIPDYYYLFVLTEKVKYLFNIGDLNRCFQYAVMSETATRKVIITADSLNYLIPMLLTKAEVLIGFKKYEAAKDLLNQKVEACKKMGAIIHLGAIYGLLARVEVLQNNIVKAENYFQLAFRFQQSAAFNLGCMQTLNNLSFTIYDRYLNDVPKAINGYQMALGFASGETVAPEERLEALNILSNIGSMYSRNGMFDSAKHYFQLAFKRLGKGVDENTLSAQPYAFVEYKDIDYIILLTIDKGNTFLSQYKRTLKQQYITDAIRIYKVADKLLNMLKTKQSDLVSKLFWRTNTRQLYEQAIEACFAGNRRQDAFYFMEKSRAVLLNDQLTQQRLVGENDILVQTQIDRRIKLLRKEANDTGSANTNSQAVVQELFILQQQRDRLLNDIKNRNPLYYQSFFDTGFINLQDVQKKILIEKEALVELFTGDSSVYVMVITKQQMELSKINIDTFNKAVLLYTSYLANPDLLNLHFDSFIQVSHHLYALLFSSGALPPGRVIISPDVMPFPFEPLVKSKPGEKLAYFIENNAVSYTYSARYLLTAFNNRSKALGDFIGLAPVKYKGYMNITDLPGSAQSLINLSSYFYEPQTLLLSKASKQFFLQNFSKYKIVQLYTHASDSSATGEPVIYFADSVLYLSDLMPENKPATELIVLSACQTGSGQIFMGEGIFSFNRGFASLGIPASLANLWAVDNESTYRLTELFYGYLAKDLPADVALQKAKLDFIKTAAKEKQLPYYWAGPVLTGKVNSFSFEKSNTWLYIFLSLTALIITVFFTRKIRKRNSCNTG